jgi:hypothetical protein
VSRSADSSSTKAVGSPIACIVIVGTRKRPCGSVSAAKVAAACGSAA